MFNTITIRIAEPEDAATIAYFSRKTFYDSFAKQNCKRDMERFLELQFSVRNLMAEVNRKQHTFLLAYKFHTLVGYALLREVKNPVELNSVLKSVELARLYVDAPFKGTGVGNMLIKECIKLARLKSKEVLWLGVWHENQRAIDFYAKWGFRKFGSRIFLLGDDPQIDWLMRKDMTT